MQASEMRFLRKIKGVTMFDKLRNTAIRKSLNKQRVATSQKISEYIAWPCKRNASGTASHTSFMC